MKVAVLFSGGKDSNYALYLASKEHEISCLISMKSQNNESYMFQSVGNDLIKLQAQSMKIPLLQKETKGEKEIELNDLKVAIEEAKDKYKIEGIVTGAIKSAYQASRIQRICHDLDLWCFNPLWQIDEIEFLQELIRNKFEVMIIGVFSYPFNKEIVGRKLDSKLLGELKELSNKFQISPAGEGGEYESFVLDGPLYKQKLLIKEKEIIEEGENSVLLRATNTELK